MPSNTSYILNDQNKFFAPSRDKIGYHRKVNIALVDKKDISNNEIEKIKCFTCEGIPLNKIECPLCHQVFCAEYYIPQMNLSGKCPKCK